MLTSLAAAAWICCRRARWACTRLAASTRPCVLALSTLSYISLQSSIRLLVASCRETRGVFAAAILVSYTRSLTSCFSITPILPPGSHLHKNIQIHRYLLHTLSPSLSLSLSLSYSLTHSLTYSLTHLTLQH